MIKIVSVEKMREIEAAADASGITYDAMMQSAGKAAAQRGLAVIENLADPRVTVLVGPGNNGGDGLVAGLAIAQQSNAQVRFYLLTHKDETDLNFKAVRDAGLFIAFAEDDKDKRVLRNMVASADLVLDALFGIGVRIPLRDEAAAVLRGVNQALNERRTYYLDDIAFSPAHIEQYADTPRPYVLAIDCPSGLDCDSGDIDKNTIDADETVTFIAAKRGLLTFPGAEKVGRLSISSAGVPSELNDLASENDFLVDARYVFEKLPQRSQDSHKGSYGKALLATGSVNYTGAAGLAAEAAYRSGAGLITVAAPQPVVAMLAARLPEPTWLMLPHDMGVIADGGAKILREKFADYKALLIGPGMGREKATRDFVVKVLSKPKITASHTKKVIGFQVKSTEVEETPVSDSEETIPSLVIDADGLNLLSEIEEWWKLLPPNTILTPHVGEMARLAGIENEEINENRWQIACEKSAEWGVVLLLKGAHTVIASPDGEFAVLPFKTDALATAGTGDVLSGLIVGFLAQGLSSFDAALVGGYIHGAAGIVAAQQQSSRSVVASDVLNTIGVVLQRITDKLG